MKEKIAARAKRSAAKAPATGASGRKPTKRDEACREFAQTSSAHIQPTVEEDNSGKRDLDSAIARTPRPCALVRAGRPADAPSEVMASGPGRE